MNPGHFLIGVDGGGSKTAVAVTDPDLRLISLETFSRSNPGDIGVDAALELICGACASVCERNGLRADEIDAVFAGIAGGSVGQFSRTLAGLLSERFPRAAVGASDDGINVLYASFPEKDGVSVICGTGSACFVKRRGEVFRIGGFGQFDLKGNGFEIGRAAFSHVFRVMDGRASGGWLADQINLQFGGRAYSRIMEINGFGKNEFAAYAPLVFDAAAFHGDREALRILEDNLSYLADLIKSAGRFFEGEPYEVSLSGGLTKHPAFTDLLKEHLPGGIRIFIAKNEPWAGAAAKAKALLSGDAPLVFPKFRPASEASSD